MQDRLELRKSQNLTNTRQYGKTFRVEFTLTKLQEDLPEQESSRQITRAHKILTKATETKYLQFQTKSARQINTPRLCKSRLNLKTSSGSRLYGKHFKQIWTTSTIS